MARKKVVLEFISNGSVRKATFNKRKKTLFKKVSELSTLCGVDACTIIYNQCDPQPEVWPSLLGAQEVIEKFKSMPKIEQSKKMLSQNSFLQEMIEKAKDQLRRKREGNHEEKLVAMMYQGLMNHEFFKYMNISDIKDLGLVIDRKLGELNLRIWSLEQQRGQHLVDVTAPPSHVAIMGARVVEATPSNALSAEVVATPYTSYTFYNPSIDVKPRLPWDMEMVNATNNSFKSI